MTARPWQHLYDAKWRRYRLRFLAKNPLCVRCLELKRVEPATIVDHKTPHRGNVALFWERANHQSLCKDHHDKWKKLVENAPPPCDDKGFPSDGSW